MPSTGRPDCTATQSGVSEPQVGREGKVSVRPANLSALVQQEEPTSAVWVVEIRIQAFVEDFAQFFYSSGLNVIQKLLQTGLGGGAQEVGR